MKALAILAFLHLLAMLAGCSMLKPKEAPPPLVLRVPEYIRTKIDDTLTAKTVYAEPDPACWQANAAGTYDRVFCNGQLAEMRIGYRGALSNANADKSAIRAGQAAANAKPP